MSESLEGAADAYPALLGSAANDNAEPHVGMNGKPCRCTPERRAWYTRGCADTCPCHGPPAREMRQSEAMPGRLRQTHHRP
jgi:hypothetical protein